METMTRLNQETGVTFVFATHDPRVFNYAGVSSRCAMVWWLRMLYWIRLLQVTEMKFTARWLLRCSSF